MRRNITTVMLAVPSRVPKLRNGGFLIVVPDGLPRYENLGKLLGARDIPSTKLEAPNTE